MAKIIGIFNQLEGHGGVQRLARQTALAIHRAATERGITAEFLSLANDKGIHSFELEATSISYKGFGGNRRAFLAATLARAWKTKLFFVNHPFIAPVALAAKLANPFLHYVVHCHGTEAWHAMKPSRQIALAGASLVTTTSDYTRRQLLAMQRIKPRRTLTLYPPLPEIPAVQSVVSNQDPAPYFLLVSRLDSREPTKGVDVAIRAYRELKTTQQRNCRLLIVGEGDDRARLEEIAGSEMLASGNIEFRTGVADNELDRIYRGALAFVLPSTQEGLGIVFLEAMARGIPAIGANAGGIPEVIDHEVNGFLIEGGNVDQLAAVMRRLLIDPGLAEKLGAAAQEKAASQFSVRAFDENIDRIIQDFC